MVPFPTVLLMKPPNFMLSDSDRSSSANVQHDENLFGHSMPKHRAHTHKQWMPYACPVRECAKTYASKEKLDDHVLAIHKLEPYRCIWSHCENNHYRGVADRAFHHVCNACGKGFARETYAIHIEECGMPGNKGTAATCQLNGNDCTLAPITCYENYFMSGPKMSLIQNWLEDIDVQRKQSF